MTLTWLKVRSALRHKQQSADIYFKGTQCFIKHHKVNVTVYIQFASISYRTSKTTNKQLFIKLVKVYKLKT